MHGFSLLNWAQTSILICCPKRGAVSAEQTGMVAEGLCCHIPPGIWQQSTTTVTLPPKNNIKYWVPAAIWSLALRSYSERQGLHRGGGEQRG